MVKEILTCAVLCKKSAWQKILVHGKKLFSCVQFQFVLSLKVLYFFSLLVTELKAPRAIY